MAIETNISRFIFASTCSNYGLRDTDDPADDLTYHKIAKSIAGITFLPTFRPDAYCNIFDESWKLNVENICQLKTLPCFRPIFQSRNQPIPFNYSTT